MRRKSHATDLSSEEVVKDIRRATRKRYSAEEKIRIVLDNLRGEHSIAELCRRESIAEGLYYSWSKEFLEAGKRRLAGDTARAATSDEVQSHWVTPSAEWASLPPNGSYTWVTEPHESGLLAGDPLLLLSMTLHP